MCERLFLIEIAGSNLNVNKKQDVLVASRITEVSQKIENLETKYTEQKEMQKKMKE